MKKLFYVIALLALLIQCNAYAAHTHVWERYTLGDRQYNETNHYACYECSECYEKKYVVEPHELESVPWTYSYWNDDVCNAEYWCKTCSESVKKPTTHK